MTDHCIITRGSGLPVLDETTGQYPPPSNTIYSGPCRLQFRDVQGRGQNRRRGEQFAVVNRTIITIPATSAGMVTGDIVTVTAAAFNAQIVGARYKVRSMMDKSQPTAIRLECEEA